MPHGLEPSSRRSGTMEGHLLAGRYKVGRLLGEGGMAVVYEGEHVAIGKRVAIKIVHALFAGDSEIVERFKREARSASAVESEHIVQVFDAGHDPDFGFFMVMELLRGEDLAKVLERQPMLDPVFACALVKQAAHALEKAHVAGVVHRDLKPANIFLTERDDGTSRVTLVDFGIAKLVRDATEARGGITRRGTAVGTPLYMSPEQAQGLETVDHRTDIYSLGVVLYEALAGQTPLPERPTYEQMIIQLMSTRPPRLSTLVGDLPPALDELVAGMLEPDLTKRIADMRVVRNRLEAIYPEIRGTSLKLKSVRPMAPSSASGSHMVRLARIGGESARPFAETSPAVAVPPPASVRRRAARLAVLAIVVAASAVGIAALVLRSPVSPELPAVTGSEALAPTLPRAASPARPPTASVTVATPSSVASVADSAPRPGRKDPPAATRIVVAPSAPTPPAKAVVGDATRVPGPPAAVTTTQPASKQVGGAGISSEF